MQNQTPQNPPSTDSADSASSPQASSPQASSSQEGSGQGGMQQPAAPAQAAPEPKKQGKKGSKVLIILLLILFVLILLCAVGYGGFWYGKRVGEKKSTEDATTTTTTTTTETTQTTTTTTSETTDPYEGWKTYENDLLGYKVRYPTSYDLVIRYETDERCVYFSKGEISINIGRVSTDDEDLLDSCFRTGMGVPVEAYKTVEYNVNGGLHTSEEIYEGFDEDGSNGTIYGALNFGDVEGLDVMWGLEYNGPSKEEFEAERETIKKIIESIIW